MTKTQILEAVARGWCHPSTEHLTMDASLAGEIAEEVWAVIVADQGPLLGLATTGELLAELTARAEINGYASYRTVDPEPAPV